MPVDLEKPIAAKAEQTRTKFRALLDKTNKENPQPKDVKALAGLLSGTRKRNGKRLANGLRKSCCVP